MAEQLQTVNVVAPGFKGLNTEESPLSIDPTFASVADNCVIDRFGRIASRRGYEVLSESATEFGNDFVHEIGIYRDNLGNEEVFSVGNSKILSGTTTLVDETPAGYTITDDNWKIVNFNNNLYFFQREHEPLVYNDTDGLIVISSVTGATGTAPKGNEAIAAWGRLWTADFDEDKSTVYWSDLLLGAQWSGGGSGSIDISEVWPDGYDEIVALAAHNNLLIIFGQHSIVVYEGADSPANMVLADTVPGIGCNARDSIVYTGTDVLFLAYDGLRSFGRAIQEKSMPINTLSQNIKRDLIRTIKEETCCIKATYSPEFEFTLLTFPSQLLTYCFDMQGTLENGALRVTRWPSTTFRSFERDRDGTIYIGNEEGISTYTGYKDNEQSYLMRYYSPNLTFGDVSKLKILKKIKPNIIGGSGTSIGFKWGYDFSGAFRTANINLISSSIAEYNIGKYGESEYSSGITSQTLNINTTGNGASVVVGLEASIDGAFLSLQEYNIYVLIGKII